MKTKIAITYVPLEVPGEEPNFPRFVGLVPQGSNVKNIIREHAKGPIEKIQKHREELGEGEYHDDIIVGGPDTDEGIERYTLIDDLETYAYYTAEPAV